MEELSILLLNLVIIMAGYFYIYPRFVGANESRLFMHDLVASGVAIVVAGSVYYGSGLEFNLLIADANWFWFTFLSFLVMEIPFALWYYQKYKIFDKYR